jgi:predicted lipid-binding transport protein (Tim44 family)
MTIRATVALMFAWGCLAAPATWADDLYIYPAKNQTPEQQEKDKYDCYQFGKSQTGFDPMAAPTATAPAPEQKGGALKGAAGGALVGAAVGAISGDVGKGAGYGAAAGGTLGLLRKRQSTKEQEQYQQEQQSNYQAQRQNYDRAYGACLEGRGYTVK